MPFAISICHEGFRYPETVRWAALHGAAVVFQPFFGGGEGARPPRRLCGMRKTPTTRGRCSGALENTLFMASVNYALPYQDAATAAISPDGVCAWTGCSTGQNKFCIRTWILPWRRVRLRFAFARTDWQGRDT